MGGILFTFNNYFFFRLDLIIFNYQLISYMCLQFYEVVQTGKYKVKSSQIQGEANQLYRMLLFIIIEAGCFFFLLFLILRWLEQFHWLTLVVLTWTLYSQANPSLWTTSVIKGGGDLNVSKYKKDFHLTLKTQKWE